jgi:tRNA pseudouridine55 synthase
MAVKQEKIILYKNRGETPLECILRFKKENPDYMNDKMTYAGRLDPLAEGLLLVLVGDECKNKEKYLKFDRKYEVEGTFWFCTDIYDLLGVLLFNIMGVNVKKECCL